MSVRALEFVETWVTEKIEAKDFAAAGRTCLALRRRRKAWPINA